MRHILFTVLSLALLSGCTKSSPELGGMTSDPIVFGGSIDVVSSRGNSLSSSILSTAPALTRIGDNDVQFADADKIKVFGYRADAQGATTSFGSPFLSNADFVYSTLTSKFTSSSAAAFWQLGKAHNFFGFYPSTLVATASSSALTAPLVVSPVSGIAQDVMIARAETSVYGGAAGTWADLRFAHMLSKVKFRIKREADASASDLSSVEFSASSTSGTIDLTTGVVSKTVGEVVLSNTFAPLTITATEQAVPGEWLVMPGDLLKDMILTIGGKRMKLVNAGSTATTSPGKINVITVTVKKGAWTFTLDIAPWTDAPVSDVADNGPYNLSVDKGNVEILSSGSFTYTTTHTGGATVAKGAQDWLTVTSGNASPVTFTATNNTEPAPRQGTITVTAGRIAKQVNIIQLVSPKIGDYFYSDNTYSTAFDANKTLLGVIYRVNPDGTGMVVNMKQANPGVAWGGTYMSGHPANNLDNGLANLATMKLLDPTLTTYPAVKYCNDQNKDGMPGWYLPAIKEVLAIYAGSCGLRMVESGAGEGEINYWGEITKMPGLNDYASIRTAFDLKFTQNGNGEKIGYLLSSTAFGYQEAWCTYGYGQSAGVDRVETWMPTRCVRAYTLQEPS